VLVVCQDLYGDVTGIVGFELLIQWLWSLSRFGSLPSAATPSARPIGLYVGSGRLVRVFDLADHRLGLARQPRPPAGAAAVDARGAMASPTCR
jgi:hypothetical protein